TTSAPSRASFASRVRVFLTGASGLLGGELCAALLARGASVQALIRPKRGVSPGERLGRLGAGDRLTAVPGDLLDEDLEERLGAASALRDTRVIVHAAANTSFLPASDGSVWATNVDGLERVLRFAARLPRLERFVYVGTAMICGARPRPGLIG